MAEFLHNKAQALLCGRGAGVGTSPPHLPCHFPQLRVHLPATFWGPSFVHPQGLPGPLLSCRAGEARLPAMVWEQGHPAQPSKGRERNEWQRARDGSGDVRTWGKGSQTPCEKIGAQQCRGGSTADLCHTHHGAAAQSPALLPPHAVAPLPGRPHGWDTATATLPHSPGALQGAGAAPCPPWLRDPGEALPGPASSQHHQEMSQGRCRSERGQEAKA